jgi:hypothetical protein
VANLAWTGINWKEGKLAVSAKPERGFAGGIKLDNSPQSLKNCGKGARSVENLDVLGRFC